MKVECRDRDEPELPAKADNGATKTREAGGHSRRDVKGRKQGATRAVESAGRLIGSRNYQLTWNYTGQRSLSAGPGRKSQ